MWNWIRKNLTSLFTPLSKRLDTIDRRLEDYNDELNHMAIELKRLSKKVTRKHERYDQVERSRSRSRHPRRHH